MGGYTEPSDIEKKSELFQAVEKMKFSREKIVDIQEALGEADEDGDGLVDRDEFRTELRKRGFGEKIIEEMFEIHDTDGDGFLNPNEIRVMTLYLEKKKVHLGRISFLTTPRQFR